MILTTEIKLYFPINSTSLQAQDSMMNFFVGESQSVAVSHQSNQRKFHLVMISINSAKFTGMEKLWGTVKPTDQVGLFLYAKSIFALERYLHRGIF